MLDEDELITPSPAGEEVFDESMGRFMPARGNVNVKVVDKGFFNGKWEIEAISGRMDAFKRFKRGSILSLRNRSRMLTCYLLRHIDFPDLFDDDM